MGIKMNTGLWRAAVFERKLHVCGGMTVILEVVINILIEDR